VKVTKITIEVVVNGQEEQESLLALIGGNRSIPDRPQNKGAKEEKTVAYTPASERTIKAAEALSKCKRVAVLRLDVLETWSNAYPHVDIASEIAKCEAWAESKDVKRTPRGWTKALNSWLSKAQDFTRGSRANDNKLLSPAPAVTITPEAEVSAWIKAAE